MCSTPISSHKDFFSGLSTTTETKILADIQSQIPRIEQLQEYDCFPTCVKAADNSYGGTMTKEDAIERLGELYDSRAGTTTSKAALERVGFHNVSLSRPLPYTIGSSLNSGGRVVVTTSNHAMLATGDEIKTITRTASILWYPVKSYTTFINVMNPAGGLYQSINARNLTHAFLFTR